MFMVGDIGGTNARFALAQITAHREIIISDFEKYEADRFDRFEDIVTCFLDKFGHHPAWAVFAVAGPVQNGEMRFTNRDWCLQEADIARNCKIEAVTLINDFAAMARAVPQLKSDSFVDIQPGTAVDGAPIVVAGPGTGFGACLLVPQHNDWRVLPGEGGHSSFAPVTDLEKDLVTALQRHWPIVSIEHICGGANLEILTQTMFELHDKKPEPVKPYEIIERAEQGDMICRALCDIRAAATMAGLANMVLIGGARGGAVIAGGVAKHLADYLLAPEAIARFRAVWPDTDFLANIPVRLMSNPIAPLMGAAAHCLGDIKQESLS